MQLLKMTVFGFLSAMLLAGCAAMGGLAGGFQKPIVDTTVRIYEQSDSALPAENIQTVELPRLGLKLTISPFPTLTERDVQSAEVYNTSGGKAIFLRFDPHGEIVLDELTTRTRGQYLVVMVNNHPVSAWLVDQRIINGQFLVEGEFTDEEAQKIVDDLSKLAKSNKQ
jgi:preprotein translocase subunit SecD